MGTRSLTYVYDNKIEDAGLPLICMYRQYDGYVGGHGKELADFLVSKTLVNGLGADNNMVANGMGCLAALLVSHFKGNKPGDFYLQAPIVGVNSWQEYEYHVFEDGVTVVEGQLRDGHSIFTGTWAEFAEFCNKGE